MSRFRLTDKTRLSMGALGLATLCLWVGGCAPAESDNSNGSGTGGKGTGGAGPSSGGSPMVGQSGGATGTGGTAAGGTGGSISGSSGGDFGTTGGTSGGNSGGSAAGSNGGDASGGMGGSVGSSGGAAGPGGGGGSVVTPVPLDPALMSKCTGSKPIKCTFPVPADGNYNVTVELGSATAASTSQIEVELGRIAVQAVKLEAGVYSSQTVSVNVHNETHDDYTAPDKVLDVLITGDAPALHGIGYAAADIPTLYVVSDSTVCDWSPDTHSQRGWAQEFSIYLKPGLAVANFADSGDTASSLYPKFNSRRSGMMKKGDYLFIQFGHNDMKIASAVTAYKANLMKYVTDARNAGATPILFSPVARRGYLNGQSGTPTVADPGFNGLDQQARDLAAAEKIAFVDLTTLAIKFYATVNIASMMVDVAHFKESGAIAISKLVADALKAGTTPATSIGDFLR